MGTLLIVTLVASIITFNVVASTRAIRYDGSTREQKILQITLTWILPVLGASLVLMFTQQHLKMPADQAMDAMWDDPSITHNH